MLPIELKPLSSKLDNLIRIGPKFDGGYIIDKRIINNIQNILTLGLSDDWRFERDFQKYNNKCKVYAYDHTVNNDFWIKRFKKDIIDFLKLKKLRPTKIVDIFKYLEYKNFFKNNNIHIIKKIVNEIKNNNEIKFEDTIKKLENVLLKIDIEGDEYKILDSITKEEGKILCLVIEFHEISKNVSKIIKFKKKLTSLKLIHIHANNYAGIDVKGDPNCIELTFINSEKFHVDEKKSELNYPINNLDSSNMKRRKDLQLIFENER
ncbi:MAG: hypothetical protein ACJZ4U_00050 [Candidatus Pelagibacter sp.]|tara:strand:- start:2952 stop:3740 length:789 start_codon:yes stop_codon:yes gene_type:complete